jgi:hypothetical protein
LREKKHFNKKKYETLHIPAMPRGFKFMEKKLQTRVHQSATGPNPVAQKWKKIQIKLTPVTVGTGNAQGLQIHRDKLANTSSSISCWA